MGKSTRSVVSHGGESNRDSTGEGGPSSSGPSSGARGNRARGSFRSRWEDLCASPAYRGRWVALDNPSYLPSSTDLVEADVVDVDDDLATLCARLRARAHKACCVLLCQPKPGTSVVRPPSGVRRFGVN